MTPPDEGEWQYYDWHPLEFDLYIIDIQNRYGSEIVEKVKSSLTQGIKPLTKVTYNRWKGPRAYWAQTKSEWIWPEADDMTYTEFTTQIKAIFGFRHKE